ncbi:hypothetical protein D1816_25145 [Aquimarina sp. AD10]|uniref:hypothetical protein n=1 Tax=Aquimarina TaxID=290174 RepID=UPI000E4A87F6|nr:MULTISPECIES: hypothetical protein [Aquimarina]AXT63488.1 hypothetical protein D1816_25145 [Aquimarina sp. AD10]RKM99794.1 hypothetical protein D7033_11550 [Aquimarina sp. AD10]
MKRPLLLLTIFIFLTACSLSKKPEFKYVDAIVIKNASIRDVTIKANAIFDNPNRLNGKLSIEDFHVFVDNIDVGTISAQEFDIPAKSEFTIPLEGTFSLSKIYKNNKNSILNSVLKVIQTDSLNIEYKGTIRYHLGSFSYPYKINKQQQVSIK